MFPNDFCRSRNSGCGVDRVELRAIVVQLLQAYFRRIVAFVGEVVGAAREAVDDLDRPAQRARAGAARRREVLVMADRHRDEKFLKRQRAIIR